MKFILLLLTLYSSNTLINSYCIQPPNAGNLPNIQDPTFIRKYGEQRIFIQGLTKEQYYFSFLMLVTSPSILGNKSLSRWKCSNSRMIIFDIVYYDKMFKKFNQLRDISYIQIKEKESVFIFNNTLLTKGWKTNWIYNNNTNSSCFYVNNIQKNINFIINNISLTPQGNNKNNIGLVPTNNISNAFSFNSLSSNIVGNIGNIDLNKNLTNIYLESITTTELINNYNFACIYLLDSSNKYNTMFVCSTLDGTLSKYSRGLIIYRGGKHKWLRFNDFRMKPIGKEKYSNNAKSYFYRNYMVTIYNITSFIVSSLPNQIYDDFGMITKESSRWIQEVKIYDFFNNTVFNGTRGLMELMNKTSTSTI